MSVKDKFTMMNEAAVIERERRLKQLIESGELVQIADGLWNYANPNQLVAQRIRREREKVRGTCSAPRSHCVNCRRIFEHGCRFNNTRNFG